MDNPENFPLVPTAVGNQKRFELQLPQGVAYVEYIQNVQGIIYLTHTEVPKNLEGKGVGSALMKKVFAHVRSLEVKLAPLCPFVASYLKRHPEEGRAILAPGFFIGD